MVSLYQVINIFDMDIEVMKYQTAGLLDNDVYVYVCLYLVIITVYSVHFILIWQKCDWILDIGISILLSHVKLILALLDTQILDFI